MKTRTRFKPGQKGTKKYVEKYGDALVCVRYRYDAETRKQYKTVEIIVGESEWTPPPAKYTDGALVSLKIDFKETALLSQLKGVGAWWDKEKKLWSVPYGCIAGTKLEKFIYVETVTKGQKQISL